MLDDIKLDKIGSLFYVGDQSATPNSPEQKTSPEAGVTVTNQLKGLLALLHQDVSTTPSDDARVMMTKELIQSGQYKVDINALSEKLMDNGLVMMNE